VTYPSEKERFYILDVFFAGLLTLKDQTIYWIGEGLREVPEDILTKADKEDILKSLNLLETEGFNPFTEVYEEKEAMY